MSQYPSPITQLSDEESWAVLASASYGRLAATAAGEIDIYPLNYYSDGHSILFRTTPGTKLLEMTIHNQVAFEIDEVTDTQATSVVVKGTAQWLESGAEIAEAEKAPLVSWVPTPTYTYVRITPTHISGRRFQRAESTDEN
ncbi:MAG TPA: pyridoxamine 5'-phosphate oxidase family protein [Glaciihabitans sp.]|jgi:nitroimidazol reductase NimA-like FMN-containing flavoprotein (pyridoxamine 5'-phosphate oxidase superfamily)|nr:pyridoxamine 5'-phosphate oxidase family protein [Glaciihabitans sp.]